MSGCCKSCKNPCMVCKRTVTTKTGLQCQGSCKSWIHFTCCSYTPGKIKDIKAKVIKVRCPCPDCSTQGPKEVYVKDSSFTCINKTCPINNPPKCTKQGCPMNKLSQQTSTCEPPKPKCPKCPEWPGMPCGVSCKKNAREEDIGDRCNHPRPYVPPCPPPPKCPGPACPPPPCPSSPPVCPGVVCAPPPCPPPSCPPPPCPPPPCNGDPCLPPLCPPPPCPPPPCPPPPCPPPPCPPPCSPPAPVMPSISIVENMCETVGLLSDQLNQLMCKMTDVLAPKGQGTPCRCPQNPRR